MPRTRGLLARDLHSLPPASCTGRRMLSLDNIDSKFGGMPINAYRHGAQSPRDSNAHGTAFGSLLLPSVMLARHALMASRAASSQALSATFPAFLHALGIALGQGCMHLGWTRNLGVWIPPILWLLLLALPVGLTTAEPQQALALARAFAMGQLSMWAMVRAVPHTLNPGEASILSALISLGAQWAMRAWYLPSLVSPLDGLCSIVLGGGLILAACIVCVASLLNRYTSLSPASCAVAILVAVATMVVAVFEPVAWAWLHHEPVTWVVQHHVQPHVRLFTLWMGILATGTALVQVHVTRMPVNTRRKCFHLIAVCLFVPGLHASLSLMRLSFSVALALLVVGEAVRVGRVWPVAPVLDHFMRPFLCGGRDAKGGPVPLLILDHIYLLLGCALPVWLVPDGLLRQGEVLLQAMSGILALGVGDTMASIVGRAWGRHRWPSSHADKSLQGTLGFVVSVLLCTPRRLWTAPYVGCITATAILEALCLVNDNPVLPLYLFGCLCLQALHTTALP
jgi:dolichol kinase